MSRTLEQRYRDALRWYPKRWRDANADVVVGTLLDAAEAEQRATPDRRELAQLAVSGIRKRFAVVEIVVPFAVRERAAAILLALGFGLAVMMLVMQEWAPWTTTTAWSSFGIAQAGFGPFLSPGSLVYLAWIAGFLFAIIGLPRVAKAVLLLEVPIALALAVTIDTLDPSRPSGAILTGFSALAICVALAPAVRSRRLAGVTALLGFVFAGGAAAYWVLVFGVSEQTFGSWGWRRVLDLGWAPLACLAVTVFILLLVLRKPNWAEGLALASVAPVAVITLALANRNDPEMILVDSAMVTTLVVAALVITVTFTRGYRLRLAPPA